MSEDARVTKATRRFLYIANPGPDSDDSDEDVRPSLLTQQTYAPPLRPNPPLPKTQQVHSHPRLVITGLHANHHSSSHPSLSPPSSSSSQAADESTPPPTTPALPVPPVEIPGNSQHVQEPIVALQNSERNTPDTPQTATSRRGKLLNTLKNPFHTRNNQTWHQKRPQTSPTTSTAENNVLAGKVLIVVTADSDWYVTVEIGGARDAAYIRECIFNKLNIRDDEQSQFSIYQTEMGAYAIGEALSDEKLFSLCRNYGDSKGSLKFFISHASAPVHEQPPRPHSPAVTTIPPPVLPYNPIQTPLRPKRRSRQESISSASEQYPLESSTGYDADLDNPDLETPKPVLHTPSSLPVPPAPPQHPSSHSSLVNSPPSPHAFRRPNGLATRPLSPVHRSARPLTPPTSESLRATAVDASGHYDQSKQFIPPPPLSPNRPSFSYDKNALNPPLRPAHGRSGSDAGAEREQVLKASEQQPWVQRHPHMAGRSKIEPSKESFVPKEPRRRRPQNELDDNWVLVNSNHVNEHDLSPSTYDTSRSTASTSRQPPRVQASPARYKVTSPYTGRPLAIPSVPRQPPPAVPTAANEPRATAPTRTAGVPLPSNFVVTWRGEERRDQKSIPTSTSSSSSQWRRLTKVARSMDNLKAASFHNHPVALQAGGRRNPVNLPVAGPTSSTRELSSYPANISAAGLPKSYDPRLPVRPLPVHGTLYSSSLEAGHVPYANRGASYSGTLMSPNADPHPRPQSAQGDVPSPVRGSQPRLQSPTYPDSAESVRSPRAVSPSRSYGSTSKPDSSYDLRPSIPIGLGEKITTSSHVSVGSPNAYEQGVHAGEMLASRMADAYSEELVESARNSESTVRPEDQAKLTNLVAVNSESTLIPTPDRGAEIPSYGGHSKSTFYNQGEDDSDSGGDDCGTSLWKKPPMSDVEPPKFAARPPLTVQTGASGVETPHNSKQSSRGNYTTASQNPYLSTQRPVTPSSSARPWNVSQQEKGFRGSTFESSTWAPRPPPEDVYERLEEFFPEHDLDKPVIEASSGGTSPTAVEPAAAAIPVPSVPAPDKRSRGKKSIRIVAEEHKKLIDRTSRADPSLTNIMRKRSTKLWGSKLEEVTSGQIRSQSGSSLPDSPSGGPTTFKWIRGELIGKGTYGRVYLALNATTGEMIAVKQVEIPRTASDKNDSRQITVVQALKLESETLKDLDHPNIVQYLGFEETPSNLSIFLEYVPGGSIGSCLMKHGKFGEDVTKSFTSQILSGLEYLHSKGILHRDLKADNILVEMSGVCKISDFGISKRTDDSGGGVFTAMQGTVFWMAPEVINTKEKGYNFKIDIWSVGCVVLEMWAGMRPWMGDEAVVVLLKLYQSKPPPVPQDLVLSELADDFRRKCFAMNPEERPTAAELRKHPYLILPPGWVFTGFT